MPAGELTPAHPAASAGPASDGSRLSHASCACHQPQPRMRVNTPSCQPSPPAAGRVNRTVTPPMPPAPPTTHRPSQRRRTCCCPRRQHSCVRREDLTARAPRPPLGQSSITCRAIGERRTTTPRGGTVQLWPRHRSIAMASISVLIRRFIAQGQAQLFSVIRDVAQGHVVITFFNLHRLARSHELTVMALVGGRLNIPPHALRPPTHRSAAGKYPSDKRFLNVTLLNEPPPLSSSFPRGVSSRSGRAAVALTISSVAKCASDRP